ncbi:hypothetical protein H8E77_16780 [bacterium]|nr:hypothetical protein [bacterium]
MAGKSRSYRKNLEFIAKDIGKELIPFLSAEDIVRRLTPEERRKLKQLLEEEVEKDQR